MKVCASCQKEKDLKDFCKDSPKKDGLSVYCRQCHKIRKRNNKIVVCTLLVKYLQQHPCVDCGETNPLVLEFDHIKGKNFNISNHYKNNLSWEAIEKEISRCEVRCANCHRIKSAIENKHLKAKIINELALAGKKE